MYGLPMLLTFPVCPVPAHPLGNLYRYSKCRLKSYEWMWGAFSSQLFISINSNVSWHLYHLDPTMFCKFHHGFMVGPDWSAINLETVKGCEGCLTVRKNVYVPTHEVLFYILHYTSLNGLFFSLKYCSVKPKTEAVPPSWAPSRYSFNTFYLAKWPSTKSVCVALCIVCV